MNTGENIKDSDLISMLSETTEIKPEQNHSGIEEAKIISNDVPKPNKSDFAPPEIPISKSEFVAPSADFAKRPPYINITNNEPVPEQRQITQSEAEQQAAQVIAFVDGIGCLFLPSAYQKALFEPGDMEKINLIKIKAAKNKNNPDVIYSKEDAELSDRFNDFVDLKNNIEFTKDEVELLKNPLANVFKKYNTVISSEMMLLTACMTVMAPRLLPLFNKMERKLT